MLNMVYRGKHLSELQEGQCDIGDLKKKMIAYLKTKRIGIEQTGIVYQDKLIASGPHDRVDYLWLFILKDSLPYPLAIDGVEEGEMFVFMNATELQDTFLAVFNLVMQLRLLDKGARDAIGACATIAQLQAIEEPF